MINNTAVIPLIVAYMGGKKLRGSTFGILTLNNKATTTGITIETTVIPLLNRFSFTVAASILL
jgi:hypothetical protein